ncbi:DinB family protein [Kribbella sp. NPDC051770]|uniref:DinB family protein n=1 Tax=Kribbella sp. NPDC051770 TaxID=3155413 RepID=UPI003438C396
MLTLKSELHEALRAARATNLETTRGLSEHDLRRPLTASGANVLGVLKHLGGMEYGYLGEAFGRSLPREIPGDVNLAGAADLWVRADESSAFILAWYTEACGVADETIASHDLDAVGRVEHFAEGHQTTTLAAMMLRVLNEELRHGGHLDILRELIDGADEPARIARIHAAAEPFRPPEQLSRPNLHH